MKLKQMLLTEDPEDRITALNEDIRKTYAELVELEADQEAKKDDAKAYEAELEANPEYMWTKDEKDELRELKRLAAGATRAVNKVKEKIVAQVGQSIQAAENGVVYEPMAKSKRGGG